MDKKFLMPALLVTAFIAGVLIIVINYLHVQNTASLVPAEVPVSPIISEMAESAIGLAFSFRTDADGYEIKTERSNKSLASGLLIRYTLTNKTEAAALAASNVPTEGPPTIDVRVYENNQDLSLMDWIQVQAIETNIEFAFAPASTTTLFGLPAITYRIDGLYAAQVYVVEKDGLIFMFTGWFVAESDPIVSDFKKLLASVRFIERIPEVSMPTPVPVETPKPDTFLGTLTEVNVGCFADGECYVMVDKVKVTVLRGWNSDTVGKVIGVDGFGELEAFIGDTVEVYARELEDGTFTLYGDEAYYVKLSEAVGVSSGLGDTVSAQGVSITPTAVLEDSRCPSDVTCVWAGTVKVSATLLQGSEKTTQEFTLGVPVTTKAEEVTLVRVDPVTNSQVSIENSEYRFLFKVSKR